jgi:proteasome alpha subunit
MTEEPYRWVEAIANRREYIEMQLASGSPIAAMSCEQGIVFLTFGRTRQKLFEIYNRIAMGAIGHPGDIERLRMAAIELASTEGFTRSAADVSLRRLAHYSLSPLMKNAFEQIYGAPFLARLLFAEIGAAIEHDLFLRIEYDGAIASSGASVPQPRQHFSVLSATKASTDWMQAFLEREFRAGLSLPEALQLAADAWSVGHLASGPDLPNELPTREAATQHRQEQLATNGIEAALLERDGRIPIHYRQFSDEEARNLISGAA